MNQSKPAVSVIIPVYNVEAYLRECLDSIVNQTLGDIEIICINDGSTDASLSILEEYQKNDSRITVVSQSNGGLSAARNSGMKRARGNYIYFIDSDDYLDITALKMLLQLATEEKVDVIYFQMRPFYESEELYLRHSYFDSYLKEGLTGIRTGVEYLKDSKDKGVFRVNVWRALWRTSLLCDNGIWFKEGILHEDNLFTFQALMAAAKVLEIPDRFYHRRVREGSIMTSPKSAENVIGYFGCAMGVLDYGLALRDDDNPEKKSETVREFRRMMGAAKRDYDSVTSQERAKVSFPTELENELFEQIVVSGQELSQTKKELNRIKQELSRTKDELNRTKQELSRTKDELNRTKQELSRTKSELSHTKSELNRTKSNLSRTKYDLDCVHSSTSFRVGRAITWLPRKVRGGVRCYKEHGARYTAHRFLEHLKGRKK